MVDKHRRGGFSVRAGNGDLLCGAYARCEIEFARNDFVFKPRVQEEIFVRIHTGAQHDYIGVFKHADGVRRAIA